MNTEKNPTSLCKKLLHNDLTTLLMRMALLYVVWFVCRILFYLPNQAEIGALTWSEIPALMRGALLFDTASLLQINALFILLSLLPFRFRARKGYQLMLFWWFAVVNALGAILNISDTVYFHYVKKRFTADELNYLDNNDNNLSVMVQGAVENWWLVLVAIALIGAMVWAYRRIKYAPTQIANNWIYYPVNTLIMLFGVAMIVGGIRGGFGSSRPITLSNATLYTPSNLKASLIMSNPFCMIRTLGNQRLEYIKYFDQATLDSLYTPYHHPVADSTVTPIRKNVVVFVLESFSSEHSALLHPELYPNQPGFTPYLDSLMREGYTFMNAYASGRKSIDALPSVLSSIPSHKTPFVLLPQSLAPIRALPTMLAEDGYQTSFFNGSPHGSMGFGAYTNMLGVERYFSMDEYETKCGKGDYDGWWGIWDGPFLQYMAGELATMPTPFFASVFTLTSHHPFRVPAEWENKLPAGKTKIHKCVAYVDESIRQFMAAAAKEPWYDNTIFLFVGDHVSSETFAPQTLTPTGGSQIVCFLYTPDGSLRGQKTGVMSQIDLMPTLLGLLDRREPYFAFGRDLNNEPERLAMAINRSGENFQAIGDSLVLFFNDREVIAAYKRSDTLQLHNIAAENSPLQQRMERVMKARIQQYYQHIENRDFQYKPELSSTCR